MKKYLFFTFFSFAFGSLFSQNYHQAFNGITAGNYPNYEHALIFNVSTHIDTVLFRFTPKTIPQIEFESSQITRIKKENTHFYDVLKKDNLIYVSFSPNENKNTLIKNLLIITRLYGYVGFEIKEVKM